MSSSASGFLLFLLLAQICLAGQSPSPPTLLSDGRLVEIRAGTWEAITSSGSNSHVRIHFDNGTASILDAMNGSYVSSTSPAFPTVHGNGRAWWIPNNITEGGSAFEIVSNAPMKMSCDGSSCELAVQAAHARIITHQIRPHTDAHGNGFSLDFAGGHVFEEALAAFYWTSMMPMVIERTLATDYPESYGFVISTLASQYSGTYPDVDHEFQIKGRLAAGSDLDLAIVKRMIELDLRLAEEDYCGLWRVPCAVQPDGSREYNVRRKSEDGVTMAAMFLVSGNVELIESAWLYVTRTKDLDWLSNNIETIELVAQSVESHIDQQGRLWSDVYYEDQVMKDGRETMSAALASRAFGLLAELLHLLDMKSQALRYESLQQKLAQAISKPLPHGYWDPKQHRFTDWVDRSGWSHDHIHLLANILPVMFGMATEHQSSSVLQLIEAEMDEFQRFPTFLSARIQDYNSSEIGDGGPYDLCAAGRYWFWDAAFWSWQGNREMLHEQLTTVAEMAESEGYIMGERYDMDHIYYVDGSPWHGAAHYYEYPCVFTWVLLHDYIGVQPSLDVDLIIAPRIADFGTVTLKQAAYQLSYEFREDWFKLTNLADVSRTFRLDLSALYRPEKALSSVSKDDSDERQTVLQPSGRLPARDQADGGHSKGTIISLAAGESVKIAADMVRTST